MLIIILKDCVLVGVRERGRGWLGGWVEVGWGWMRVGGVTKENLTIVF